MPLPLILTVLLLDVIVFTAYTADVLLRFGVTANLSMTYYLYERLGKGRGLLFPALLLFICATTIPIWIYTTLHASPRAASLLPLPLITLAGLLFVALSSRYKMWPRLIYFHYAGAIIAGICDALWLFLAAPRHCYIALGILAVLLLAGLLCKSLRRCAWFWIEAACFYALFFTLLLIHIRPVRI